MAEKDKDKDASQADQGDKGGEKAPNGGGGGAGTATVKPKRARKPAPKKGPPGMLPPWKGLLHNDDKNDVFYVVETIVELTPLNEQDAKLRMLEAHETGVALLLTTHKERPELYKDQFETKGLTVTIEPAEKA